MPMTTSTPVVVDDGDDFDLSYLFAVFKRRALTFLGVTSVTALGLGFWHMTRPPQYRGNFQLLVEPVTVVNKLDLGEAPFLDEEQTGLDYNSQIQVLRSPNVLEPILADIQEQYPEINYGSLNNSLTINQQGDSKILSIGFRNESPDATEVVLQELAQGFIQYSVQDRQADLRRGIEFLDEQLDAKWKEVEALESDLSELQKQHDLVDIETVSASVTERMNSMLAEREALQVDLSSLRTLYDNLQEQVGLPPEAAIRITSLSESPQYQAMLDEYRQIEQDIALESARFQADTPMVQALEDKRQQLLPLLQAEAKRILGTDAIDPTEDIGFQGEVSQSLVQQLVDTVNQIQVLQTKNQAISQVTSTLQGDMQYLADLGRNFKQIERELRVAESSFNQLLATRQQLRFQMARQNAPWELMTPLTSSSIVPVDNLPRKLVLSGVVAVLLGGAAALLQDKLDKGFHSTDELQEATKLPALAKIPYIKALEEQSLMMNPALVTSLNDLVSQRPLLVNQDDPVSYAFAEAFYSLHTNLRLLGADKPVQAVTISSTQPGEGKSTACAHLAIAATNMGQRVLIIDADMRRPTQHIIFGMANTVGLSNYLTGNAKTLRGVLEKVPGNPSLQVLCAGVQPPAPGGLLSSKRMHHMVNTLRRHFDMIIIDTPPLMSITDAKIASTYADGMLLVAQIGRTPRDEIARTLSDLNTTIQAPLLGLIVNNATKVSGNSYYTNYYHKEYSSYSQRAAS